MLATLSRPNDAHRRSPPCLTGGSSEGGATGDGAGRFALLGMAWGMFSVGTDLAQSKGDGVSSNRLALGVGTGLAQPKCTRLLKFDLGHVKNFGGWVV